MSYFRHIHNIPSSDVSLGHLFSPGDYAHIPATLLVSSCLHQCHGCSGDPAETFSYHWHAFAQISGVLVYI